uniref:Geranylgeranyl reductase family protein n=1 Tax=Fervidicoccus fontis TaxID=683846 RepID=A0A7J3ZK17_9CREN
MEGGSPLRYDVVIVGAGPAGSSLAYFLSGTRSLRVAVIESKEWSSVWSKPCGNAIGLHHFTEKKMPLPQGEALLQEVEGIWIYSPSESSVFKVHGRGVVVDRVRYGQQILKAVLDRGVDLYLNSHALKPIIEGDRVVGVLARVDNKAVEFRCNVLVDASGAASAIKRRLPQSWPVSESLEREDAILAFRGDVILEEEIESPEYLRIYLNQEIAPGGYWWFFPSGERRANVGLGVQYSRSIVNLKDLLLDRLLKRRGLASIRRYLSLGGALVPTRRPLSTLVWNGIVVIGDAGFNVNPLHGGGIGYAMDAALYASSAIQDAFEAGDFSARGLWKANLGYMKTTGAKQASLDLTRLFLQRLSNNDLQFIMERRIITEEEVDLLSRKALLDESVALRVLKLAGDVLKAALKLASRPSLLLKITRLVEAIREIRALYESYPESPEGLMAWKQSVDSLVSRFKRDLDK